MTRAAISRRIFLNIAALATAGLVLPGCGTSDEIELDLTAGSSFEFFDTDSARILLDVANILIPRTDTAGAQDTGTILYLDQLMAHWAGAATQSEIGGVAQALEQYVQQTHQSRYLDLPDAERLALLREIDRTSFSPSEALELATAYRRLKGLIFHIHYTSEAANPDFVLIPGQYLGDVSEAEYAALVEDNRY